MMDRLNEWLRRIRLHRYTSKEVIGLGITSFILVTYVIVNLFISPYKQQQYALINQQKATKTLLSKISQIVIAQSKVNVDSPKINVADYMATTKLNLEELLKASLKQHHLYIRSFKIGESEFDKKGVETVRVEFEIRGNYKDSGEWLFTVKEMPVLTKLTTLTIRSEPMSQLLTLVGALDVYLFNNDRRKDTQ